MKRLHPKIFGMAFLGTNLACSSALHSRTVDQKGQESSMNIHNSPDTKPNTRTVSSQPTVQGSEKWTEDSGSFASVTNGRKQLELSIDVASTIIRFVPMNVDFKVTWQKGESCDQIEISETPAGLEIKHSDRDGRCGESKIEMLVNEKLSTYFSGGSGLITIKDTQKLLKSVDEIYAIVMAGSIESEENQINIERQWSQSIAQYLRKISSNLKISLSLGAGSILFSR